MRGAQAEDFAAFLDTLTPVTNDHESNIKALNEPL